MSETCFRPLAAEECLAMDEAPDIADATIVNGVAFKLTGDTWSFERSTAGGPVTMIVHGAVLKRRCGTDDLRARLHGVEVPGIGIVRGVEAFATVDQGPGATIGIAVAATAPA